jgi:predicted RNA-binding Zn-ribbon protein involved in translation (DUF1610 family)
MALKFPNSMDECIYFTNRNIGENKNGKAICWVFKQDCPKCKKAKMGKPIDPKTKRPQIRAKEYVCPACNYTVEKVAYEESLTANIQYTCPKCGFEGEAQVPFKRKSINGVKTLRAFCEKCKEPIDVTKKMKEMKKKGKAAEEDALDDDE